MPTRGATGLVSVIDLADELGVRKQTVFKALRRLGVKATKRKDAGRGGQAVSFVSGEDANRLRETLDGTAITNADGLTESWLGENTGFFYVIQLEPDLDPTRLKLGFTIAIEQRLRQHRCSAPFAAVVRTWPCRRTWEQAAIDCLSNGCERLHTEVFRVDDLEATLEKAQRFFALMPTLADPDEEADLDG